MLLLLLLVTPLVNAGDDSCSTPCTCSLPEPLKTISSTRCITVVGTWYGLYSYGDEKCYFITFIDTGDNRLDVSLTEVMENECSQTIVTYNGTGSLGPNNKLTGIAPCGPRWNGDYVSLATDCKTYAIYGVCKPGSCEPIYYIQLKSKTPSDCTMNQVKKDLTRLGLSLTNFKYNC